MKKSKKLLSIMTVLLLIVCMAVPVSAATKISKKKATLKVGQTLQLKVTGTKKKPKWTSSKKSVATVSSKGRVKAKKKGTATITAKVGKKKYTCKVTVKNVKNNTNKKPQNYGVTYYTESTDYGAIAIFENHYDYPVSLSAEFVYYLNGYMVGAERDTNYAFAPHTKCALQGWNYDKEWDSYKINLTIKKAGSNLIYNNSGIRYKANFGMGNVMVQVDNKGKKNYFTEIAVVFYQNGRMVGYEHQFADVKTPGSTAYLEFSFPHGRDYKTITPDRYEVYVNSSYTYDWIK